MVRFTAKSRAPPCSGLQKSIEKKKKVEKKQGRFFRLHVDNHPLNINEKLESDHIDSNSGNALSETMKTCSSSQSTMRGVLSLPMVLTEKSFSELSQREEEATDNLLAGLFSPSDYQKNIDSPVTPVSSESVWTLGPLVTPDESSSVACVTPEDLGFCSCKNITSESSLSDEEEKGYPTPKFKKLLYRLYTQGPPREVRFEEETSSPSKMEGNCTPRKRLTKRRPRKELSDTDRITALEMEVHLLKEMVLALPNSTHIDMATQTEKVVEEMVNPVSEKSSVRQRVALFEAQSDTAVAMKNGEISKRQTHTV